MIKPEKFLKILKIPKNSENSSKNPKNLPAALRFGLPLSWWGGGFKNFDERGI